MKKLPARLFASALVLGLFASYGCNGDDDDDTTGTAARGGSGAKAGRGGSSGRGGTAGSGGLGGTLGGTAGRSGAGGRGGTLSVGGTGGTIVGGAGEGASSGEGAQAGSGGESGEAAMLARGEYLVNHVAACIECHTPRRSDGSLDTARLLGGNPAFADLVPADDAVGLIPAPNLTPHATGLRDWTDEQIKNAFLNGVDDEDEPLFPIMPYYVLHNMTDEDANAIVAYLRSVPAVNNAIPERQELPAPLTEPAAPVPVQAIPEPTLAVSNPNYARAQNGRYLAGMVGICMECHSTEATAGSDIPLDLDLLFAGGREFDAGSLGLPTPPFPAQIVTPNLTPASTGIASLTTDEIVRAIRRGIDDDGTRLCPPMPAGLMEPFAGITPTDAEDIAIYLKAIGPIETAAYPECTPPEEGAGGASGAGGNGP